MKEYIFAEDSKNSLNLIGSSFMAGCGCFTFVLLIEWMDATKLNGDVKDSRIL